MNHPSSAREALIVEAIGDVARLLDRVEALRPAMDEAARALAQANAALMHQLVAFESRMVAITETAKNQAVKHIARRTDDMATQSVKDQTRAMADAAQVLFNTEIGPSLQRLSASLRPLIERVERPWDDWLMHAATAAVTCAATWAVAIYFGVK